MTAVTTDLERADARAAMTGASLYDQADRNKLAAFKNKCENLTDVDVAMALEMIASIGLNPWSNEVYAAKAQNGRLLIMAGRDGLLRKAEEFPDYRGYDCGVVYAKDTFQKGDPDSDGKTLRARAGVSHIEGPPGQRGEVIGAWAVAEREGRPPRYFYAPWSEYVPNLPADKLAKSPWGKQKSVMIEKVPISVVHRTLCNLSGVYLPEEAAAMLAAKATVDGAEAAGLRGEEERAAIVALVNELEVDAGTALRLTESIDRLNELSPGAWGLAKCQMTLPGLSFAEIVKTVEQIEEDIAAEESRRGYVSGAAEEVPLAEAVAHEDAERERLEGAVADLRAALEQDVSEAEAESLRAELTAALEQLDALEA